MLKALVCASSLMGLPVPSEPTPVSVYSQLVLDSACLDEDVPYRCGGVFFVHEGEPRIWIVDRHNFPLMVHEECHRLQYEAGLSFRGAKAEAQCLAIQRAVKGGACAR